MCDGAVEKDGVGFSKADAGIGAWLGMCGWERDAEFRLAEAILWRYAGIVKGGKYKAGQIRRADVWGAESESESAS